LLTPWHGGFCNALNEVPRHLQAGGSDAPPHAVRPLRALSGDSYADEGRVLIGPIDGQVQGCLWHRLFAEAALADGGAIELALAASDIDTVPSMPDGPDDTAWARHVLLPGSR